MSTNIDNISDGATCLKVGGAHEKPDLQEAFHERRTREFGEKSGGPPFPQKKGIGIGGDAITRCLEGLICCLLRRSSITFSVPLCALTLSIFMQIWTNYKTHIFKSGAQTPLSPPVDNVCWTGLYKVKL